MLEKISSLSVRLTNRLDEIGNVLSDPELIEPVHIRKFQELLSQTTAFSIAVVELNGIINKGELKSIGEINSSVSLLNSVDEFLSVTDIIFAD